MEKKKNTTATAKYDYVSKVIDYLVNAANWFQLENILKLQFVKKHFAIFSKISLSNKLFSAGGRTIPSDIMFKFINDAQKMM